MSKKKYLIEIEPCSSGGGYYINVYFADKNGRWEAQYNHRGLALTYWGARYGAWWRKIKFDNSWIKTERGKETVYES